MSTEFVMLAATLVLLCCGVNVLLVTVVESGLGPHIAENKEIILGLRKERICLTRIH